jgi:hypothetical protein
MEASAIERLMMDVLRKLAALYLMELMSKASADKNGVVQEKDKLHCGCGSLQVEAIIAAGKGGKDIPMFKLGRRYGLKMLSLLGFQVDEPQ